MGVQLEVHDARGLELVSQDLLGFTMTRLQNHLVEHGWQLTHQSMECTQFMFCDAITEVLTITIRREAGIDTDAFEEEVSDG